MIKIATRKKRKKRKLKKEYAILFIVLAVLIVILMLVNSINKIKNFEQEPEEEPVAVLDTPEFLPEDKVFEVYNLKEIVKQYEDNKLQINLSFEKNLYNEDNTSNEKYFENVIKKLVENYNKDFTLKDEKKGIVINVKVKTKTDYTYSINDIEDYFKQAKEVNNEIKNHKEIESVDVNISNKEFNKFDLNNWSVLAAGVEVKEKGKDYLDYGNYKVLTNDTYIDAIILDSNFEEEITEGIKVGDTFEEIEKNLGDPTFETNNMVGYKTYDAYVFFYNNEAILYPNEFFDNKKIEGLIQDYIDGKYSNSSRFAYEVIHYYMDFASSIDEQGILNLTSPIRGINIQITEDGKISAEIYNNYNITETTKKYVREEIIKTNFDKDFVFETELNRIK